MLQVTRSAMGDPSAPPLGGNWKLIRRDRVRVRYAIELERT